MSRADLIVNLVRAGTQGDQGLFRSTVEAMAAEERAKHHHQLAERLEENLRVANARPKPAEVVRSFDGGHGGLLYEIDPRRTLGSVLLPEGVGQAVPGLIVEQQRSGILRSYGVGPRHRRVRPRVRRAHEFNYVGPRYSRSPNRHVEFRGPDRQTLERQ